MYLVTKLFLEGPLKGCSITEETSVAYEYGKEYKAINGFGGWDFIITNIHHLTDIRGEKVSLHIPYPKKLPHGVKVIGKA